MCSPTPCACGKFTWVGCGEHVDDVRRAIPAEMWCGGVHEEPSAS